MVLGDMDSYRRHRYIFTYCYFQITNQGDGDLIKRTPVPCSSVFNCLVQRPFFVHDSLTQLPFLDRLCIEKLNHRALVQGVACQSHFVLIDAFGLEHDICRNCAEHYNDGTIVWKRCRFKVKLDAIRTHFAIYSRMHPCCRLVETCLVPLIHSPMRGLLSVE